MNFQNSAEFILKCTTETDKNKNWQPRARQVPHNARVIQLIVFIQKLENN